MTQHSLEEEGEKRRQFINKFLHKIRVGFAYTEKNSPYKIQIYRYTKYVDFLILSAI